MKDFFDQSIITRLDNKAQGAIILVMQRLHVEDLVAHVQKNDEWEIVSLPAIETEERAYQLSEDRRRCLCPPSRRATSCRA